MFCLATKILTYLPFFYLIIFMTSNCQDALGLDAEGMVGLGAGAMGLGEDMACLGANLYFSAMD